MVDKNVQIESLIFFKLSDERWETVPAHFFVSVYLSNLPLQWLSPFFPTTYISQKKRKRKAINASAVTEYHIGGMHRHRITLINWY